MRKKRTKLWLASKSLADGKKIVIVFEFYGCSNPLSHVAWTIIKRLRWIKKNHTILWPEQYL